MRLARQERQPEGTGLLVGESPSPAWELSIDDRQSFAEFYARTHGPLLDYAERFLSKDDAHDAESEAMVVIWRNWPVLSLDQRNDRYVFGILTILVRASLTANANAKRLLVSLDDAGPELDRCSVAEAPSFYGTHEDPRVDVLEAALAAMPPRRREVLLLRYERGFSHRAVAEALGLSASTVNTHVTLGYQDLRAAFTRAGFPIPDAKPRRLLLPRISPKGGDAND